MAIDDCIAETAPARRALLRQLAVSCSSPGGPALAPCGAGSRICIDRRSSTRKAIS
jgi:hypothetical protein